MTIVVVANSLAYYDYADRYNLGGLREDEVYPNVLAQSLGSELVAFSKPWRTVKGALSVTRRVSPMKASAYVLQVGIVEAVPRGYPFWVRKIVERIPNRLLKHRMNILESRLLRISRKECGSIDPSRFGRYLQRTVEVAKARLNPGVIIVVGICRIPQSLESTRRGTRANAAALNRVMKREAKEVGAEYLDLESALDERFFLPDLVHFNRLGHLEVARLLQGTISPKEVPSAGSTS